MKHKLSILVCPIVACGLALSLSAQCPPPGGYGGGGGGPAPAPIPRNGGINRPKTPATPAPASPGAPGPTTPGPATPGPGAAGPTPTAVPTGGARSGSPMAGPRGRQLVFTRERTSKEMLAFDWDLPVASFDGKAAEPGAKTVAKTARRAIAKEDVYAAIAGDDRRPLLVMRECTLCRGSDAPLMRRGVGDERTQILAKWFHCVKLPPDVVKADHPFHHLFDDKAPPHIFLAKYDGSERISLQGNDDQSVLWDAMNKTLEANYKSSPNKAVKKLQQLLSEFDNLDQMEQLQREQMRKEIIKNGLKSSRLKKLEGKLAKVLKKKKAALARAAKLRDLGLDVAED